MTTASSFMSTFFSFAVPLASLPLRTSVMLIAPSLGYIGYQRSRFDDYVAPVELPGRGPGPRRNARAAETLGIDMAAADPAVEAGLIYVGWRVETEGNPGNDQ